MKIGVCFKIVPDYEDVLPKQWAEPDGPDTTYVKKMIGCFDEAALESALRLADSLKEQGAAVETAAVTAGDAEGAVSASLMRSLFAAGFDQVTVLPGTDPFEPQQTAKQLAGWLQKEHFDLILTGKMVGPFDSGTVPFYLAEELGFDLISQVTSLRYEQSEAAVFASRKSGVTEETIRVTQPSVCSIGDAEHPYLRLFSIKARLEARKREFTFGEAVLSETEHAEKKVVLRHEEIKRDCIQIEGSVEEMAKTLAEMIGEVRS